MPSLLKSSQKPEPKMVREFKHTPPKERLDSLPALVRDFKWRWPRHRRDTVVTYAAGALNLQDAIYRAVMSRTAQGKMHNHQSRVPTKSLRAYAVRLKNKAHVDVWASGRPKIHSFDQLYDICWNLRIKGIGVVTVYDVATRIGAYLGLEPDSLYLHAGVLDGARELGVVNGDRAPVRIPLAALPRPLHSLTADECEDFLCAYRGMLGAVRR